MTARETILGKLRAAREPFTEVAPVEERRHMVPLGDASAEVLLARFIAEAQALHCDIHEAAGHGEAIETLLNILGDDKRVLMWDPAQILLDGLAEALAEQGVQAADLRDAGVRVGLTGVDAALAATGSLVVVSGPGKARQASLLPIVHVAVVPKSRILPDLETFYMQRREAGLEAFRETSNIAVISGPSKSADIAAELIHGMHGPGTVHIILVD